MAEVLGIVACVAQLIDLSARVLVASTSLYDKLKNIPGEIETLKKNTELFIDLLWMISSDFDSPMTEQVHPLHVSHRATSILHEAVKESEELALLLEALSANGSSSMKRKWSVVVSKTKEEDIAERCRRIESLKSSLHLWYQHQSNAWLRTLKQQLSCVAISQTAAQANMSLLARQSSAIADSNKAILTRLDSYKAFSSSLDSPVYRSRRRLKPNNTACNCCPSRTNTHFSIYNVQLFCSHEQSHSSSCPSGGGSTSLSFGMRALHPKIQVMVGVQLGGLSLSLSAGLSPHNVVDREKSPAFIAMDQAFETIVDLDCKYDLCGYQSRITTSKALTLSGYEPVSPALRVQEEVESVFKTLMQKLLEAFESGTASPVDHTPDNRTLLHSFVTLAMRCPGLHETLYHLLNSIAKLLVAGSTDANATALEYVNWPIDPLSRMFTESLFHPHFSIERNKLGAILINHGCDTSHTLQRCARAPELAGLFRKNPSLLEDYGQHPDHIALIQRSEAELSRLVSQDSVDLKSTVPPILCLAIGWPTGLRILLDAGASPEDAILAAIYEQHLPSIELLIDSGCPMFDVDYYVFSNAAPMKIDLLSFALTRACSSDVVCLLLQKLVHGRRKLLQLALRELPEPCLKSFGYEKQHRTQHLLDHNALSIFRQLEAHKVQVPLALWPGSLTTIYHHREMTYTLAKKLYDVGFRSINETDKEGRTPLMQAILIRYNFEHVMETGRLARWYIRKGARLPRSLPYIKFLKRAGGFTGSMSARIWVTKGSRLYGHLQIFQKLHPEGVEQRSICRCWCTMSGCTPVGIVLRSNYGGPYSFIRRRRWLFNMARYSSLGLSLSEDTFADICRLEIFDRLGMAHTCFRDDSDYTSDERTEIQEEDQFFKQALDSYLNLYLRLLQTHSHQFESFWVSWWIALEYSLPFELGPLEVHHPLELADISHPRSYDNEQSYCGYSPNSEAITAFITECIPKLTSEVRADFLCQFEPSGTEQKSQFRWLEYWYPNGDEDEDGDDTR